MAPKRPQNYTTYFGGFRNSVIFPVTSTKIHFCTSLYKAYSTDQESIKNEKGSNLLPAIVFDHVGKFDDEFSFFVFLTALKCMFLDQNMGKKRE